MANTPNLNLEEPAHGSANWDTPLNSNFTKIDAGVILTAPLADQTIAVHNLTDNQGTIRVTNTAGTLQMACWAWSCQVLLRARSTTPRVR